LNPQLSLYWHPQGGDHDDGVHCARWDRHVRLSLFREIRCFRLQDGRCSLTLTVTQNVPIFSHFAPRKGIWVEVPMLWSRLLHHTLLIEFFELPFRNVWNSQHGHDTLFTCNLLLTFRRNLLHCSLLRLHWRWKQQSSSDMWVTNCTSTECHIQEDCELLNHLSIQTFQWY
jgi:hypothetical protein